MFNFFFFHPAGETIMLLLLAVVMLVGHQRDWVSGKVALDVIVFLLATVVGYFVPGWFFFVLAFMYTGRRIYQG